MISTLEILERSIYTALLSTASGMGLTLDPAKYYPITPESIQQFNEDKSKLQKFISIYGAGTSTSKGAKLAPRIVVDSKGYFPGSMGLNKINISQTPTLEYESSEFPYEALDQMVEIRLVTESQEDMRILHNILFYAIPQRGYLKPWPNEHFNKSGNIFIEVINFYDKSDNREGIMEKVYQFMIFDCVLEPIINDTITVPLKEVEMILDSSTETSLIIK